MAKGPEMMTPKSESDLKLEIAHILTIDVVAYSTLLIDEQSRLMTDLAEAVKRTSRFRQAETDEQLIRLPTGDGMALVFLSDAEAPLECAMQICAELKGHPEIRLRMGVHSGPVKMIRDVNDRPNLAGAGMDVTQRVMDCGDAGHILVSKRVADDLAPYPRWHRHLHDLGECLVKHGRKVWLFNFYTETVGNPEPPQKLECAPPASRGWSIKNLVVFGFVPAVLLAGLAIFFSRATPPPVVHRASLVQEKSIAVLPFESLSTNRENEYFTDGVQEEILLDLAKIADLKVISRTSVMQFKSGPRRNVREIAQQLGVAHVLEGSVQRTGSRLRVTAELIDARSDTHLWGERYDRDITDVFTIQSEIAKKIADQLQAQISPREKSAIEKPLTNKPEAHDLYLRARALWGDTSIPQRAREKLFQAAELLDTAIDRDPDFLLAWCLLSRTHATIYRHGYDHTQARLDLARSAAETAMRLEPQAGETHLALANYYYYGFRDYSHALSELLIAARTLPNNVEILQYTGLIDRREGRWIEATQDLQRALELDPRNSFILQQLALTYAPQHRYAEEAGIWDRLLAITPGDPSSRIARARVALDWCADREPYRTTLLALIGESPNIGSEVDLPFYSLFERDPAASQRALERYPAMGVSVDGVDVPRAFWEGAVARCEGEMEKARSAFSTARTTVAEVVEHQPDSASALSLLGMIDAGLGRKEEALREGRLACEMLPVAKDAVDGSDLAVNLALIYAWIGEKSLAIEQIRTVERLPNLLSYGCLKLHPFWDSLRKEPEFERILTSLAPKS